MKTLVQSGKKKPAFPKTDHCLQNSPLFPNCVHTLLWYMWYGSVYHLSEFICCNNFSRRLSQLVSSLFCDLVGRDTWLAKKGFIILFSHNSKMLSLESGSVMANVVDCLNNLLTSQAHNLFSFFLHKISTWSPEVLLCHNGQWFP